MSSGDVSSLNDTDKDIPREGTIPSQRIDESIMASEQNLFQCFSVLRKYVMYAIIILMAALVVGSNLNIQRVTADIDHAFHKPPVNLPLGETILSRRSAELTERNAPQRKTRKRFRKKKKDHPISHNVKKGFNSSAITNFLNDHRDEAEKLPIKKQTKNGTFAELVAADALVCRQSVINFVINATDGKDECNGLQKAWEKTCSNDENGDKENQQSPSPQGSAKRRLREHKTLSWKVVLYQIYTLSKSSLLKLTDLFYFTQKADSIGDSWDESSYPVTANVEIDLSRIMERVLKEAGISFDIENDEDEKKPIAATPPKRPGIMDLPMPMSKHATEKQVSDALMIQQEGHILKAVENKTNSTRIEAIKDAAASSKAVSDATEIVSAVLNDPSSVEARTCCASILNVYHETCSSSEQEDYSDQKLFIIVAIMALCGIVKSLIKHFKLRWLPEAGGCILVGVAFGCAMIFYPHQNLSFDGNWFLRIMVPPIVFEAALSIDKKAFKKYLVPILMYAVAGTLVATYVTGWILHQGTIFLGSWCTTIPYVESLTFAALISSIDPIAVLSVLGNMGMSNTDTIYVLIFGESLLNDGVAIVLFQTLVHFLDDNILIDSQAIAEGAVHFLVVFFGSFIVGVVSGILCTVYFWLMHGCQTPLVEVLMFFCWALIPYYVCDGIEWSGIVSVVATGFIMDLYVVGRSGASEGEINGFAKDEVASRSPATMAEGMERRRRKIFSGEGFLSEVAYTHIRFVAEIIASTMETAIFAYLGYFLFSNRYHWSFWHVFVAIFACCASRGVMITCLSTILNWFARKYRAKRRLPSTQHNQMADSCIRADGVVIDKQTQLVLWVAGLRGAMSFALVESVPLYDTVSGEGTPLKPELKAMTSASIMFTVFVLGGLTHYMVDYAGLLPSHPKKVPRAGSFEIVSLMNGEDGKQQGHDRQEMKGTTIRQR